MLIHDEISVDTRGHTDVIDVTGSLQQLVQRHRVRDGLMICMIQGSTAALTTIEYEPNLVRDLKEVLDRLIPPDRAYHHHKTWGDDNGHAHLRASLVGPSLALIVRDHTLLLGTWQQVVLVDFDTRPRTRTVHVAIYAETAG